jgi:hypothetical protein
MNLKFHLLKSTQYNRIIFFQMPSIFGIFARVNCRHSNISLIISQLVIIEFGIGQYNTEILGNKNHEH